MSRTVFSPCRKYRYTLWRLVPVTFSFEPHKWSGYVQFIGLNPSTADETVDDPTIRRCRGFASAWGFTSMCMTNLFAWRDTKPANMKRADEPVGVDNDRHLLAVAQSAGLIICCWGIHGHHLNRHAAVSSLLSGLPLHHLGLNDDLSPRHPLFLRASTQPTPLT